MKPLIILLLLQVTVSFAQLPEILLRPTEKVNLFESYKGSIYQYPNFKEASVIDEKASSFNAKLRYNIYLDQLECKIDSELKSITKTPTIHARIETDYYYYCDFQNQRGLKKPGYYVLVELNDRYRIYKRYTVKIKEPVKSRDFNVDDIPGKIDRNVAYYIEERGIILELPVGKKEMLATLSDKSSELKAYMKKNKIKLHKEEDLIQLIARYTSLKFSDSNPPRTLLSSMGQRN